MEIAKIQPSGKSQCPGYDTPDLVGIGQELSVLDISVRAERHLVAQIKVLQGPVGSGKSRKAWAYREKVLKEKTFNAVFWIDATDLTKFHQSCAKILDILPGATQQPGATDLESRAILGLSRLRAFEKPWLLILDGLEDPDWTSWIENHLKVYESTTGAILITTRRRDFRSWDGNALVHPEIRFTDMNSDSEMLDCFFSVVSGSEVWYRDAEAERKALNIIHYFEGHFWIITQIAPFLRSQNIPNLERFLETDPKVLEREVWSCVPVLRGQDSDATTIGNPPNTRFTSLSEIFEPMFASIFKHKSEDSKKGAIAMLYFLSLFGFELSGDVIIEAIETKKGNPYQFPWGSFCMNEGCLDKDELRWLLCQLQYHSLLGVSISIFQGPGEPGEPGFSGIDSIFGSWLSMTLDNPNRSNVIQLALETFNSMFLGTKSLREYPEEWLEDLVTPLWLSAYPMAAEEVGRHLSPTTFLHFINVEGLRMSIGVYSFVLDSLKEIPSQTSDRKKLAEIRLDVLRMMGEFHMKTSDFYDAQKVYTTGLKLARREKASFEVAAFLGQLGNVHFAKKEIAPAMNALTEALSTLQQFPSKSDRDFKAYRRILKDLEEICYHRAKEEAIAKLKSSRLATSIGLARGLLRYELTAEVPNPDDVLTWIQHMIELYPDFNAEPGRDDICGILQSMKNQTEPAIQAEGFDVCAFWSEDRIRLYGRQLGARHWTERRQELDWLVSEDVE
ncbi:Nephrocystin-3 [Penicillium brevicompactum]|uniref:uncharacterized protein n=1 Tax=Penicillium brevicompactum TaxID=5074 RepID=UPI0025413F6A|nr:uncharacterized protein N7506_006134 [Penicillium brevicompactum]KAJ5332351.1 hypothetical protein N7506_006134 [Penicillium brevicompactum]